MRSRINTWISAVMPPNLTNTLQDDDDLKVRPADDNGSTSFSQMDINVATLLW